MAELNISGGILQGTLDKIFNTKGIPKEKLTTDAVEILKRANELGEQNILKSEHKIGLVYGRVQSGKTNAMIASTALAFDNGYKIAIILTSNSKELVSQTKDRFDDNVCGVDYYIRTVEYRELRGEKALPIMLQGDDIRLIIVVAKGSTALETTIQFLGTLGSTKYKTIVFDDEGDNYSLDNNRKDRDEEEDLPPTKINELIFARLTNKIDHVLVSVTGTPQGVLLEGTNQSLGFKYLLEPGDGYTGGKEFFEEDSIFVNDRLFPIDPDEVVNIYEASQVTGGLADALMTFYTVATLFSKENAGADAQFLCHPNLKVDYHRTFHLAIQNFHNSIMSQVMEGLLPIQDKFRVYFDQLKYPDTNLHFDQFFKLLRLTLIRTNIVQLNALQKDTRSKGRHEILIGGNILGRGVTIENMLVMYYGRNAKITNMDTLYQHARMFGYRKKLLKYMKIYMPEDVYQKFHFTYETDEWLRAMTQAHPYDDFPIKYYDKTGKLKFTRSSIESKSFLSNIFIPRKQFYPNHISAEIHKENALHYTIIEGIINNLGEQKILEEDGVLVDLQAVNRILGYIKSSSTNKWQDGKVIEILASLLSDSPDKKIRIYKTKSERRSWEKLKGAIPSGTLHSSKVNKSLAGNEVSMWLSSFLYDDNIDLGKIWYPTIVFPEKFGVGKIYLLNK